MVLDLSESGNGHDKENLCCRDFQSELSPGLNDMRKQGRFCDVVLRTGDGKTNIPAHKVVIAAGIPYFRGMMMSEMAEYTSNEIVIKDVDGPALKCCINFVYNGELTVSTDTVQPILMCSNYLQMRRVTDFCCNFIVKRINNCSCLVVQSLGRSIMNKVLVEGVDNYLNRQFVSFAESEAFLDLSMQQLASILSRDALHVRSEVQVFAALKRWVERDYAARCMDIHHLFQHVRLTLLEKQFLNIILADSAIVSCSDCNELVSNAIDFDVSSNLPKSPAHPLYARCCYETQGIIYIAGGVSKRGFACAPVVSKCMPSTEGFEAVSPMHTARSKAASAVLDGQFYVIGGEVVIRDDEGEIASADVVNTVELYAPATDSWRSTAPVNVARMDASCIAHNSKLLICGGTDCNSCTLSSCEVYEPTTEAWSVIATMIVARSGIAVASFCGVVHVLGGRPGHWHPDRILNSVERYIEREDKWIMGVEMLRRRCQHGASSLRNQLYVYGGFDEINLRQVVHDSCEVFDCLTNQWSFVSPMPLPSYGFGSVAVAGKIYCVGGYHCLFGQTQTTQIFDAKSNEWSEAESALDARMWHSVGLTIL